MMLTREDVEITARLAGLRFIEEQTTRYREQIGGLVHLFGAIGHHRTGCRVYGEPVNDTKKFDRPDLRERWKESAAMLAEIPMYDGQFILVPALFHRACDMGPNDV